MGDKCTGKSVFGSIRKDIESGKEADKELERQIEALRAMGMSGPHRGEWRDDVLYATDDIVSLGGVMYSSTVDRNISTPPSATWTAILQADYGYYTGE